MRIFEFSFKNKCKVYLLLDFIYYFLDCSSLCIFITLFYLVIKFYNSMQEEEELEWLYVLD